MADTEIRRLLDGTDDEGGLAKDGNATESVDALAALEAEGLVLDQATLDEELASQESSSGLRALAEATAEMNAVHLAGAENAARAGNELDSEVLDAVLGDANLLDETDIADATTDGPLAGPLEALDEPVAATLQEMAAAEDVETLESATMLAEPEAKGTAAEAETEASIETTVTEPAAEAVTEPAAESVNADDVSMDALEQALAAEATASDDTSATTPAAAEVVGERFAGEVKIEAAEPAESPAMAASTPEPGPPTGQMMVAAPAAGGHDPAGAGKTRWDGPPFLSAVEHWKPVTEENVLSALPSVGFSFLGVLLLPLEWMDRPFAGLSPKAKSIVGMAGILTLLNVGIAIAFLMLFRK